MIHRTARNPTSHTPGASISGHIDNNVEPQTPELTPRIYIEDASPTVFTFAPPTKPRLSYRPPSHGGPEHRRPSIHTESGRLSGQGVIMFAIVFIIGTVVLLNFASKSAAQQARFLQNFGGDPWADECPDYKDHAARKHLPFSKGPLKLPFQRPVPECRTFISTAVEDVINSMTTKLIDKDLARLFENCYPSTLDTTIRWHIDEPRDEVEGPQTFVVTGDINAEWLRDSTNQLAGYQMLAKKDTKLKKLILGAIYTQADMVIESPYCNAFQPPRGSGVKPANNGQNDNVHPNIEPSAVFECKYELDSLASFLALGNQYFAHTGDFSFVEGRWADALDIVFSVLDEQSIGTFDEDGAIQHPVYTFQRYTNVGTETLALEGRGNPLNNGTQLIRSAFRPSDDATILQYFIPGNAFMSVELKRVGALLTKAGKDEAATKALQWSESIAAGIQKHGVVDHPVFGKVFAYEVDGYGSRIMMDDANLPSLLSLPLLGFVDVKDEVYQNTRKMVLSQKGNPYFLTGPQFEGIGGPHIGLKFAWPMSIMVQIMTTDDDMEISNLLSMVKKVSRFGLINESVNVYRAGDYTRSWFAWANSVFAQTIFDLAKRKPELLFGKGAQPWSL